VVIPPGAAVQVLPFTVNAAALAREALRIHAAKLPAATVEDAALLASELVTNAVRHGRPPVKLGISVASEHLIVSVIDTSPELPKVVAAAPSSTGGRGLHIVDSVADMWGVEPDSDGKVVWFRLNFGR
jgi:anti-sigma regulatory factor (Ser/Thr protein kinase)